MTDTARYELDPQAQTEILSLIMWDYDFVKCAGHLVKPTYFDSTVEQVLASIATDHHQKYGECPSTTVWVELLKSGINTGLIRKDQGVDVVAKLRETHELEIRSRAWLIDAVKEFARQQAIYAALMLSAKFMAKTNDPERFRNVEAAMKSAFDINIIEDDTDYDFFEMIEERSQRRLDVVSGKIPPAGITTGVQELNQYLYHKGWGRQELSLLMGGAKASKSFHLSFFAYNAAKAGHNVLFFTLENSIEILSTRLDAQASGVGITEQFEQIAAMDRGVRDSSTKSGKIKLRAAPIGTLTPNRIQVIVDEYKTKGIKFDLIVIDYIDIMAPNFRVDGTIENSRSILIDTRAIAQRENLAILSAIQTNREGHKSATVRAEHAAEDFNKIRIADVVLSINRTDDEKAESKARITFAASRNSCDSYTLFVTQDLNRGLAIKSVDEIE